MVRKIYPLGFIKWSKYDPEDELDNWKLEEIWKQCDFKDTKLDPTVREGDKLYRVAFERNTDWEWTIVESMRTLVGFNIFMNPQEKKIKLEIKKYVISGLIDKLNNNSGPATLKSVTALWTSLILVRKLLSVDENTQILMYNKENVMNTIKDLKADGKVFKALADLMKTLNPLSVEAQIINPLLVPLLERMTFSEDSKKESEGDNENLLGEEANESEGMNEEGEGMSIDEDSPAIEIEIEIDAEDP